MIIKNPETVTPIAVGTEEAAAMIGISRPTLYQLMGLPGFPAFKLGGRKLINVRQLQEWIDAQTDAQKGDSIRV